MSQSPSESSLHELTHDILNFVAAAKMSTEMALRQKDLSDPLKKHLDRIKQNLFNIQARIEDPAALAKNSESPNESERASEETSDYSSERPPEHPSERLLERLSEQPTELSGIAKVATELPPKLSLSEKTVLVVDDSADIRLLFGLLLKPRGYTVTTAKNGAEALEILSRAPFPNLILLDFALGDLSGSEVLDALEAAKSEIFKHSKFVMLSGHGNAIRDQRVNLVKQKAMDAKSLIALVGSFFED